MVDAIDRRTLLLGAIGVSGAVLAGCTTGGRSASSAGSATSRPTPSPTPPVTPTDTRPRWPLTGRLLAGPGDARHAAVAVKVPDNRREHPQVGLDLADVVFVELDGYRDSAGYSSTRLMPVFHSRMPRDVAPVRSIRPVDVPLLGPMGAVIGNTGATGWVLNYVEQYRRYVEGSLSYLRTKGSGSYSIDPKRIRTYQGVTYFDRAVVCHPAVLAKQTTRFRGGPARPYFPFAATAGEASTRSGKPARAVQVPWKAGDSYDMGYRYDADSGTYLRSMPWGPHVLANGVRVAPDNVLVIRAVQRYTKLTSGSGGVEPVHEIVSSRGSFFYVNGGRYVAGTWTKGAVDTTFRFTCADGSPLQMAPGQTYVELPAHTAPIRITA